MTASNREHPGKRMRFDRDDLVNIPAYGPYIFSMVQRTTVRLPDRLLIRARPKAAAEGRTLASLIEDGLRAAVSNQAKPKKLDLVLPRVSTVTGSLQPEIDLTKMLDYYALEDEEYVERMKNNR